MIYDDLVPATGPRPTDAPRVRRRAVDGAMVGNDPSRRTFLKGAVAAATATGFVALGVFPKARSALAGPSPFQYGYRIKADGCPPYAADAECVPGCGPSQVLGDTCEPSGFYAGFFKNQPAYGYRLRPGNCYPGKDGWKWGHSGQCGTCRSSIEFRCHDGYKRQGGGWFPKVCRHTVQCDGRYLDSPPPPPPPPPVDPDPIGGSLVIKAKPDGSVVVKGWALDPNTPHPIRVKVKVDGVVVGQPVANLRRDDIPTKFVYWGKHHGFKVILHPDPGERKICVSMINVGKGHDKLLRCHRVNVATPPPEPPAGVSSVAPPSTTLPGAAGG